MYVCMLPWECIQLCRYLQSGESSSASDAESHFSEVCNALDLVGFEGEFQEHIFTCLAAVLHIGNIEFMEDQNEHAFVLEPRSGPIQMVSVSKKESSDNM